MEQIINTDGLDVKPCPFCGDNHISISEKYETGKYFVIQGFSIGCNTVGCFACHSYARPFNTKEDAIKAWNSRIKKPDCNAAFHNPTSGKCYGYGRSENDDEPIEACQKCPKYDSYGIE